MDQDPQYLKNFVKEHPDNKMGWYLLGRHYEETGQKEKSFFCYAKAGEIFEAFEDKKLPLRVKEAAEQIQQVQDASQLKNNPSPVEVVESIVKEPNEKSARTYAIAKSKRSRNYLRAAAILLLLLIGILYLPGSEVEDHKQTADNPQMQTSEPLPHETPDFGTGQAGGEQDKQVGRVVYVTASMEQEHLQKAAGALALTAAHTSGATVLVEGYPSLDGKWTVWTKEPRILFSVEAEDQSGKMTLKQYDKETCRCLPADRTAVTSAIRDWQLKQEQEILLRSALSAYHSKHGGMPANLQELTGNYPNNTISAITQEMNEAWEVEQGIKANKPSDPATTSADSDPAGGKGKATEQPSGSNGGSAVSPADSPFVSPLEIIVDQNSHRLAIVSGKIILRSYPVGLGGSKTHEGSYTVTEKVKNPNGKTTGPFGSRGMTLSDTLYAIHGTDDPDSIGKDLSLGCIRMLKGDLEELYDMTPLGTKVTIGKELLPSEIYRAKNRLHLPAKADETNPAKVYSWLD